MTAARGTIVNHVQWTAAMAAAWLCCAPPLHATPQAQHATGLLAVAHSQPQAQPPAEQAPPATPTISDGSDSSSDPTAIFRAPLIREGSAIVDAVAHLERDTARGCWKLVIERTDVRLPQQELALLPCTQLSQMQHIVKASPDRMVRFQVSGRVFVYRGRNYLLPTYAPVAPDAQPATTAEAPGPDADASSASTPPPGSNEDSSPAAQPGDSDRARPQRAADIMRDLERAVGPMRAAPVSPTQESSSPAAPDSGQASNSAKLLPEEAQIVSRRGKIARDGGGGWVFIFDADASGLSDPPMRLLPCLLLERIEDYARRSGNNSPALLSGPVYLYEGQNYLLPTVFRIPQERRNITP